MGRSELLTSATGRAVDDRYRRLTAEHRIDLRRMIDDLVEGQDAEVQGHELDDRSQTHHRRADPDAGEAVLGDRRVPHSLRAEFVEQTFGDLVGPTESADLLAQQQHSLIPGHLRSQTVFESLPKSHLGHGCLLLLLRSQMDTTGSPGKPEGALFTSVE